MQTQTFHNTDEYIAIQDEQIQPQLQLLRSCIHKAAPKSVEVISYQMPAFQMEKVVAYFAAFKHHYSLFVIPRVKMLFEAELAGYSTTKSAIHFAYDKPLPKTLIAKIVKQAVITDEEMAALKRVKKSAAKRK